MNRKKRYAPPRLQLYARISSKTHVLLLENFCTKPIYEYYFIQDRKFIDDEISRILIHVNFNHIP